MNDEILQCYLEAGQIARNTLHKAADMVRPDVPVLEVVEAAEAEIRDKGAEIAFPINISFNECAAHDTAGPDDERQFASGDLVKVDLGVHVDGYIADTALTVDLGKNDLLVEASRAALESAIALVRPGIMTGELGEAIQREIESRGYRPIANLTGHGLDCYDLHGPPTIPNIGMKGGMELEEGMAFAIEPFATTGSGKVSESPRCEIYSQISMKPVRMAAAKRILESVRQRRGLPFARRWVASDKTDLALMTLKRSKILHAYPVLHDIPGSLVSQHEHTLIVTGDGCTVTTR